MERIAIIHYDEIALKGENRPYFEEQLARNIREKITARELPFSVENHWGRIVVRGAAPGTTWGDTHDTALADILATTPGVTVFGIGYTVAPEEEAITAAAVHAAEDEREVFATFRVSASRADKTFAQTSQELNVAVGAAIGEALGSDTRVQLSHPDAELRIEVLAKEAYVYRKRRGPSGLPVGSSGRAVVLLSGGFDSPVAAYLLATRGVRPLLLHFHAYPQTSQAAIEKVRDLAAVLRGVCGEAPLALAPLLEAQREIALSAPEKLRVILYRRLMMRVAEQWARTQGATALITGESVGQVASQTLENIAAIEDATTLPVLRPLSGMHKQEIIRRSREIGTHDISVQPHDDTCTIFMPAKPETKAKLDAVRTAEASLDTDRLVADIMARIEIE